MTFQHLMRLCVVVVCVCGTSTSATAQTIPAACHMHPFAIVDLGATATRFGVAGLSGGLNDKDEVAGNVPGTNPKADAAVYTDGTVTLLGTLRGSFSYATGLNNAGKIVGFSYRSGDSAFHAVEFSTEHPPADLGTLGGTTSVAYAVNTRGTIVGAANLPGDKEAHAARFTHQGPVDLGTLGGSVSAASAMNDMGDAVGISELPGDTAVHAVLYPHDGGKPIDLGTLGGNVSAANGINDDGLAVGYSIGPLGGPTHAAIFMSWAMPIDLGGGQSQALAINRAGGIVGFTTSFGGRPHGALWTNAGGSWSLADLNTLIDPATGWTVDFAWAINDRGTVEASGHRSDAPRQEHTILLLRCDQS